MTRDRRLTTILLLAAGLGLLFAVCSYGAEVAHGFKHQEVRFAVCTQCHPDRWPEMDHTLNWDVAHKSAAARAGQVCGVCHRESFCTDCHANKEEIKPSDKHKDSPDRSLPHRGDYITQHKIDGKINPASCFRCHGRQNNSRCRVCHR
jgi:hypothetical protein